MQKREIAAGKIYKMNHKTNAGSSRAFRFSVSIHRDDRNLKEGNSISALKWAKGFKVK